MNMEILLCIYQKDGLLMARQDKFTLKKSLKIVINPKKITCTFQGKTYTEEEWKAFEQDPWGKVPS